MSDTLRGPPPPPPNKIYPGVHTSDYPPKQILKVQRQIFQGHDVLYLMWATTRDSSRAFRGFDLFFYEHKHQDYDPSLWRKFPKDEVMNLSLAGGLFLYTRKLVRHRRYYFSIRILDDLRLGPFSDPVGIDF